MMEDLVLSVLFVAAVALRVDQIAGLLMSCLFPRRQFSCHQVGEKSTSSQDSLSSGSQAESVPECVQSLRSSESSITFDLNGVERLDLVRNDSLKVQVDWDREATVRTNKPEPSKELSALSEDWVNSSSKLECEEGSISFDDLAQTNVREVEESSEASLADFTHCRPTEKLARSDSGLLRQNDLSRSVAESYLYRSDSVLSYDGSTESGSFDVAIKVSERVKRRLGRKSMSRDTCVNDGSVASSNASVQSAVSSRRTSLSRRPSFGSGVGSPVRQRRRMSSASFMNERGQILRETMKKKGLSRGLKSRPKKSDDRKILDRLHSSGLSAAAFCR